MLFFVPVGAPALPLMRDNVLALSSSYPRLEFFFAHYDGPVKQRLYEKEAWYREKVGKHACAYAGFKAEFIYKELVAGGRVRTDKWLSRFKYVWVADDNMDFTHTDVRAFVHRFGQSGAAVGQPLVERSFWSHLTWRHLSAQRDCAFRYVPLVEVMTPIFTVDALALAYTDIFRSGEGATQDMGMDEVWCAYLGSKLYGPPTVVQAKATAAANTTTGSGKIGGSAPTQEPPRRKSFGLDGRAACVVVDAAVAVKRSHSGHAYGVKQAQADRHRVHELFKPFVYPSTARELTRGACARRCGAAGKARARARRRRWRRRLGADNATESRRRRRRGLLADAPGVAAASAAPLSAHPKAGSGAHRCQW